MKNFFGKIGSFVRGLLSKPTEEKRAGRYVAEWKTIKETPLKEGDSYRLGPEATVHVGPPGPAGKKWITKRVRDNEEKRRKKYEKWWAEKREKCVRIMLMSEEELKASGIYDEVQKFLKENEEAAKWMERSGLLRQVKDAKKLLEQEPPAPSGKLVDRFDAILKQVSEHEEKEAALVAANKAKAAETYEKIERGELSVDDVKRAEGDK